MNHPHSNPKTTKTMATIRTRKDSPFFFIEFTVGKKRFRESTGIRHEGRKKPAKGSVAWQLVRKLEDELAAKHFGMGETLSFQRSRKLIADAINEYKKVDGVRWRPATRNSANNYLDGFVKWAETKRHLNNVADITRDVVKAFISDLREEGNAESTIKGKVSRLGSWWGWMEREGYTPQAPNPFHGHTFQNTESVKRALDTDEIKKLIESRTPMFVQTAVMLGLYTGCRISNVRNLKWEDIDLSNGVIDFTVTKTRPYKVPIHPVLATYLQLVHMDDKLGRAFVMPDKYQSSRDAVFNAAINYHINRVLPGVTFHALRHTFVSLLAKANVSKRHSQLLANHSQERIHDHYTHVEAKALAGEIAKITI